MSNLGVRLKQKIKEHNLSTCAFEKKVGLKPSAINNIIYGRSKNPSATLLQTIAKGLNCSLSELLDDDLISSYDQQILEKTDNYQGHNDSSSLQEDREWNCKLFLEVIGVVSSLCKNKKVFLSKKKIMDCIEVIYSYSLKKGNKLDIYFAEWMIEHHLKNERY
jgi:transcriptional regulator with XRE-family HTH domain